MLGVPYTAATLLDDLAPRHPHERVPRAVEVARRMAGAKRRALLAELGGAEPYCRHLAVTMAAATGESGHLLTALRDPYPAVRRHALHAPGVPDEGLVALAEDGSWTDRLALYARLRRRRQAALADRLLPPVRERWGDAEAARLLSACSGGAVADALPGLGYAVPNWTSLAIHHLDAVVGYATAGLAPLDTEARVAWWGRTGALQRALALHQPAALLDLCERFLTGAVPWAVAVHLRRLLAVDPVRVARLLLADRQRRLTAGQLTRSVRDRLAALPDPDLGALLRAGGPAPGLVASVLRGLPPGRREAVFDGGYRDRDLSAEVLPDEILAVLPHARRHAEAGRMLALPAVATDPPTRLRITSFLPHADAFPLLDKATRSAEAEERALGYELLVRSAARTGDPATVTALLAGLDRVRNERDPVRSRLLVALAEVRPDLFEVATIGALDGLVRDALDARDCSYQTTAAVHRLVFRVLWQAAASDGTAPLLGWALDTVERISGWHRVAMTSELRNMLRRGQEHDVFDRIRDRLTESLRRNEAQPLLVFARSLGRRAWRMPELQKLVGKAARNPKVGGNAISLWLAPPAGRSEKAARLVLRDESTLTQSEVLLAVARHRTDLVDEYVLAGRPLRGRFSTGKARWVPTVDPAALARWTPGQVERYAALVHGAVLDKGLDRWRRAALARTVAGLPGTAPTAVAGLIGKKDVLIAEAALTGLARCDRPDLALPVLLDNMHGDRARVAVFAAGRCARDIAPSRLGAILRAALAEAPKVTVRKEAARLLSTLRVPGAVDALVAAWERDGQHRDVRVAVAAGLRGWLDDPRSWVVLEAAVDGERHVAESLLDAVPYQLAERDRERYAALVRRLTRHPEPEVARRAYAALAAWVPWAPGSGTELVAGVTDPVEGPTWRHAASAALTPAVWTALPDLLPELATTLVRQAGSDADAEPLRDLPARQRLTHLVGMLSGAGAAARRQHAPVRRMVEVLAASPTFVPAAAQLSAVLVWPGPGFAADLAAVADLLVDLPWAVPSLDAFPWEPAEVAPGVDVLAGRGDVAAGLLAVALTGVAGERAGWPEPWRERLRDLRRHPAAAVRQAALAVFTVGE
jgi:hypothetical protein